MTAAPTATRSSRGQARPYVNASDRAAAGRAARAASPRRAHGDWAPPHDRPPAMETLERQSATRIAELIPLRYGRMAVSPFAFYRGTAAIMAADLAAVPRTGLEVQLCGDAHLSNFGGFAAPDRRLVFSINDFDETLPGPFEWDLKRLVASFAIAGRQVDLAPAKRREIVVATAAAYRGAMREFAAMNSLDLWYTRLDVDEIARRFGAETHARQMRAVQHESQRAQSKTSLRALDKLTRVVDGQRRFISDPPVVERLDELFGPDEAARFNASASTLIDSYMTSLPDDRRVLVERFRFVDAARKVVGVGSVGTRAWVVLLVGRDDDDPLVLQFKEAQESVLAPHLGASGYHNQGQRIVEGQRLMQAASDILLGWQRAAGFDGEPRDYFVRQLWDRKGSVDIEQMRSRGLLLYAHLCGWTLARAHARTGDSIAIASYLGRSGTFDRAMAEFAEAYADQAELDHAALQNAIATGAVDAVAGR